MYPVPAAFDVRSAHCPLISKAEPMTAYTVPDFLEEMFVVILDNVAYKFGPYLSPNVFAADITGVGATRISVSNKNVAYADVVETACANAKPLPANSPTKAL